MSIQTKEKIIDGKTVSVTQFPARRALLYKAKLAKLITPVLGELIKGLDLKQGTKLSMNSDIPMDKIIIALDKFAVSLEPHIFVELCVNLLQCTRLDGKELNEGAFDFEFAGNTLLLYKIIWFILQVNFSDFFGMSGILNTGEAALTTKAA